MRKIYLIRHGKPDIPDGERVCLGRTDLALGSIGHEQGKRLHNLFKEKAISKVYCSSLLRSIQTAHYISDHPTMQKGLDEQDQGEWDGLSFQEIQVKWPELYQARGKDRELLPPGAEDIREAACRFTRTVLQIMGETNGDIVIVAHKSVIQSFLCLYHGRSLRERHSILLEYGSVVEIEWDEKRKEHLVYETNV